MASCMYVCIHMGPGEHYGDGRAHQSAVKYGILTSSEQQICQMIWVSLTQHAWACRILSSIAYESWLAATVWHGGQFRRTHRHVQGFFSMV